MKAQRHHREADSWNLRLVGHCDLDGAGDGMHINLHRGYAFFSHMGNTGTSIVDVRDPEDPRLVGRIPAPPNTHSHKVQIVDDVLLVNRERLPPGLGGSAVRPWAAGLSVYDVGDPRNPREIGYWACGGKGVHRMTYWSAPYAYVAGGASDVDDQFLMVVDFSDPARPVEVGRWWYEGMHQGERASRSWGDDRTVKFHHGIPRGDRLYGGMWDAGLVILDISDPTAPTLVSLLDLDSVDGPSRCTHTGHPIPGRDLLVVTDECTVDDCKGIEFRARLVDISDEKNPTVVSRLPTPPGDFCSHGGRFGPHNVHEMRPGSWQSSHLVHVTWFNAGLRVFDVTDEHDPREIAYYVPKAPAGHPAIQLNDLTVDEDGLIYVSDRFAGGLYIFELDNA
ncbi:MAG: hypothetical protein GEU93_00820 [Propionibacteriales bacterium]|nr:hypothetical protein [Propionibacteriales bacterium]